jgi:hypothetical protein
MLPGIMAFWCPDLPNPGLPETTSGTVVPQTAGVNRALERCSKRPGRCGGWLLRLDGTGFGILVGRAGIKCHHRRLGLL